MATRSPRRHRLFITAGLLLVLALLAAFLFHEGVWRVIPIGLGAIAAATAVSGIGAMRRDKKRHTNS